MKRVSVLLPGMVRDHSSVTEQTTDTVIARVVRPVLLSSEVGCTYQIQDQISKIVTMMVPMKKRSAM